MLLLMCWEFFGPLVNLLYGFRFRHAVTYLDLASQHLNIAFDLLDIVVCKFAPLVVHGSMQLLPIALNLVM